MTIDVPLSDQSRILHHRLVPRIVALHRALSRLQTVVSFMNSGAHPDDEISDMLAALGVRDGIDISYACSTRGDGGQNDIGTESGAALGVLRTAEMERAADVLNLRLYWLGQSADDPIRDFGFSKSGEETLQHWGGDRTPRRFVEIVRTERPDILCPTFLDVPGQHGHHRAMTAAAHDVVALAADPSFETGHAPWQIAKLYLPAWSGAGQAYDDDLPPPPKTLTVLGGRDPITGFSYDQIGQQSRAFHLTQAMGRWVPPGKTRDWPLHLAQSHLAGPDEDLSSGLPATLADLGLRDAQTHFDAARAAFPDFAIIQAETAAGLALLQAATLAPEHDHKVNRKIAQAAEVIQIAAGVGAHIASSVDVLTPGDTTTLSMALDTNGAEVETRVTLPDGWHFDGETLHSEHAAASSAMPDTYLPDAPTAPFVTLSVRTGDVVSQTHLPFETPPLILPSQRATLDPVTEIVNLRTPRRSLSLTLRALSPATAVAALTVPNGWTAKRNEAGFEITLPNDEAVGRYQIPLTLDGQPAQTAQIIRHPHIPPRALTEPAEMSVHVIDCAIPSAKIGYIGGGNDRVDHWLACAGFDITALDDEQITAAGLEEFDALVIGIFAIKFRPGLADAMPILHEWTAAGGTLLTLYHRPWDNWDPDTTPPKRIEIGQPSLRWRVTDQAAAVTHLTDHLVLSHPNNITESDWKGWYKERGLYFAKSWDNAYTPLLSMADPDEAPLTGALLTAEIGKGRHTHCALILHHQLAYGVPGAYRLMANLLAPR
ncbi:PIG-L family deacetylase [uncultured Tateyamaria sp.]|uniref:PIG-L family deacetylase n=1 Tax=uncultured Tateyamaria sp. TaxID=455651 RepID=UPI002622EFC6|nr:PIG-L family deacetylase [uncultured Tateyamaria sp.]